MERIAGLREYVAWKQYRSALGLPDQVMEEYHMLARGECNKNYLFTYPVTGRKLVLHVNCGSQMHLERQIQYEYDTLKLLLHSGRTPRPFYVGGSLEKTPYGVMVTGFLPGHPTDYGTELPFGAECLADIHSVRVGSGSHLVRPEDPLETVLTEYEEVVRTYMDSDLGDRKLEMKMRQMLNRGWRRCREAAVCKGCECCVNTEPNSTNFLINGEGKEGYLVDWKKPVRGEPAQDLGHFLVPTTAFWKTDAILSPKEMESFINLYIQKVNSRFDTRGLMERTLAYTPIICLQGITWCTMAWMQYRQPDKLLFNQPTFRKLGQYLNIGFLEKPDRL